MPWKNVAIFWLTSTTDYDDAHVPWPDRWSPCGHSCRLASREPRLYKSLFYYMVRPAVLWEPVTTVRCVFPRQALFTCSSTRTIVVRGIHRRFCAFRGLLHSLKLSGIFHSWYSFSIGNPCQRTTASVTPRKPGSHYSQRSPGAVASSLGHRDGQSHLHNCGTLYGSAMAPWRRGATAHAFAHPLGEASDDAKVGTDVMTQLMTRTFNESGGLHGPRLVLDAPNYSPHGNCLGY